MNNKPFLVNIPPFAAGSTEDVAKAFATALTIIDKNTVNGQIEMPFTDKGIEVEMNSCYVEDGYIKGYIGSLPIKWED